MRTFQTVFVGILCMAGMAWAQDSPSRVARLSLIEGQVSYQPENVEDWSAATLNYPLTTGAHLYSDQASRAEMRIGPNAIRLGPQTNFGYLNLNDNTVQMRVTEGALHIRVRALTDADVWEVDTPNGAISLLRTGEYRIDTDPQRNATMVTVRSGQVAVTANRQSFNVLPGQTAYFTGDSSQEEVKDANPVDGFDAFWEDRDRAEDAAPAPRYVSRSMVGYEDLEANGFWTETPDYGAVWFPRVSAGWAPYRYGHWAWVAPWGWTWIDDASWGFAPFHYGRWAYVRNSWGWCPGPIAPRPVYAPALVVFVGGGNWGVSAGVRFGGGAGIGWFPLGPREVYVPSYGRRNVTVVNNITVNNVYINRSVPGAFTAVSQRDFVEARAIHRVAVNVPPNMVASAPTASFAAPVAPERGSYFGRPQGQIGSAPRPSAEIYNRPVIARTAPPAGPANRPPVQVAPQPAEGRGFGRSQQPQPAMPQQDRMSSRPPGAQPRSQQPIAPQPSVTNGTQFGRPATPQQQPQSQPRTEQNGVRPAQNNSGFGRQEQQRAAPQQQSQPEQRQQPRAEQRREMRPEPKREERQERSKPEKKNEEKPNH